MAKENQSNSGSRAGIGPPFILALLLCLLVLATAVLIGHATGTLGLSDFDTCWLLATGREIVSGKSIPAVEPFSFTFSGLGRTYVAHQWLSATAFYLVQHAVGLQGLLYFGTILAVVSLVAVPVFSMSTIKKGSASIIALMALASFTTVLRLFARPELFSMVCLAVCMILLNALRNDAPTEKPRWSLVFYLAALIVLWVNLHSGFLLGCVLIVFFVVEQLVVSNRLRKFDGTAVATLIALIGATLCNPYGFKLVDYDIRLMNSPVKTVVTEMMPITPDYIANPCILAFVAMSICCIFVLISAFKNCSEKEQRIRYIFTATLMAASVCLAFLSRRFVNFSALILLYQSLYIQRTLSAKFAEETFTKSVQHHLIELARNKRMVVGLILLSAVSGTTMAIAQRSPTLPQTISALIPPFKAIEFISAHPLPGRVYNDAHFGSMLTWYCPQRPKVFIDTRYDEYELDFVRTYGETLWGHNYEKLFNRYKIDWIFIKPQAPLVRMLLGDKHWRLVYGDEAAVIFQRSGTASAFQAQD
ncbi:MAG TPA: hypothetical protein V6C97_09485 [Oculatellaceae cyanobacterium]